VREVRIDEITGTAEVIVPDYQLSLAIGKEGQNARLSARLTGWRVDIKSETQLAEEEAYANQEWAEGEWIVDADTGEQVWVPAEGGEALSAEAWTQKAEEQAAEPDEGDSDGAADDPDTVDETVAEADVDDSAEERPAEAVSVDGSDGADEAATAESPETE
jgi:transcription termination/antitermination protein NusA